MSIWIREMDFLANLVKQRIYSSETIVEALDKAEHLKIVRCEDCKYWNEETHGCNRNPSVGAWWESDFCSYGEPRERIAETLKTYKMYFLKGEPMSEYDFTFDLSMKYTQADFDAIPDEDFEKTTEVFLYNRKGEEFHFIKPKEGEWIPVDSYSAFGGDEVTWEVHGNPTAYHYCSECKEDANVNEFGEELLTNFCPNCGARMKGETNEHKSDLRSNRIRWRTIKRVYNQPKGVDDDSNI